MRNLLPLVVAALVAATFVKAQDIRYVNDQWYETGRSNN